MGECFWLQHFLPQSRFLTFLSSGKNGCMGVARVTFGPIGADVPIGMTVGDSNTLSHSAYTSLTSTCYPLSLDSAHVLESPDLTDQLMEEVKTLPVYSSFPKNPGYQDIRASAEEIKSFLSSHAVYSLELSSVPQGENLL